MKRMLLWCWFLVLGLTACSGVETITRKPWNSDQNTIMLRDLSKGNFMIREAGTNLKIALEDQLGDSMFIVTPDANNAKYMLKFKVTRFDEGSRFMRIVTFGMKRSARAMLTVKVALVSHEGLLGAWEVTTWVSGGWTGGDPDDLFDQAAEEIIQRLKGY